MRNGYLKFVVFSWVRLSSKSVWKLQLWLGRNLEPSSCRTPTPQTDQGNNVVNGIKSSTFAPLADSNRSKICKPYSQTLFLIQENGCFKTFALRTWLLLAFLEYNFYHYSRIQSRIRKKITAQLNSFCSLMWFLRH